MIMRYRVGDWNCDDISMWNNVACNFDGGDCSINESNANCDCPDYKTIFDRMICDVIIDFFL